mgnify:FL=1
MTIDELIKAANEYRKRYDITYSEGVILPLASIMADFASECVKDALALADAADNYCDRCGDIVQVNAIERAIRAERERIGSDISYIDNLSDYEERAIEMQKLIDELRGGK